MREMDRRRNRERRIKAITCDIIICIGWPMQLSNVTARVHALPEMAMQVCGTNTCIEKLCSISSVDSFPQLTSITTRHQVASVTILQHFQSTVVAKQIISALTKNLIGHYETLV